MLICFRYYSKWHVMPLHVQKLIMFILQRGTKNCMLVIGGLYIVSLEGFAMVIIFVFLPCTTTLSTHMCSFSMRPSFLFQAMSTSVSYFMVIYSTRWRREREFLTISITRGDDILVNRRSDAWICGFCNISQNCKCAPHYTKYIFVS